MERNIHVALDCPAAERGESIVLAKAGGIGGMPAVSRQAGVKAKEGHGGRCPERLDAWIRL